MIDDEGPPRRAPAPASRHLRFPSPRASLLVLAGLVVAMALVLALLPSAPGAPIVTEALDLATEPTTGPARAPGVERGLGWRPAGSREDDLGDREAVSVAYERDGLRAVHTVVGGDPLEAPDGASEVRGGVAYTRVPRGVTWERDGHTHVLSGAGVPQDELLDLATRLRGGVEP